MDALSGFLDGPRARGAFLLRAVFAPPWSLRVQDRAPLCVIAIATGSAWVCRDGEEPVPMGPGDVALLRGPDPYVFADDPATPPQAIIHPGQRCETPEGHDLAERMTLGVRTWGNSADGPTVMLIGAYEHAGEVSAPLLSALPPTVVLRAGEWPDHVAGLLAVEIERDDAGQAVVLDRLLDLLTVTALRAWLARADGDAPAWYRAGRDPVVGRALGLLHRHPAEPWTVASLAAECGVSRAALARRFTELVGEPPMAYLTERRLAMAADLLCDEGTTIGAVARQVGYGSAFALSAAFTRERGISPSAHRAAQLKASA